MSQSLQGFFDLLHSARLEFAFRTISEIMRYLRVDFELLPTNPNGAWQDAWMLRCSRKSCPNSMAAVVASKPILVALATYCEKGMTWTHQRSPCNAMRNSAATRLRTRPSDVAFPLSRTKLLEMIEAVRRDQFVSFIQ